MTLNFTLSDYQDGMTVNVSLDGLLPADGTLTEASTRAAVSYVYTPSAAGKQTIRLKTTSGAKTCSAALSAYGFDNAEGKLEQSDIKTAQINCLIEGSLSGDVSYKKNDTYSVTITIGDISTTVSGNKITQSGRQYNYSFNISRWTITYSQPTDVVNIRMRYNSNSMNYYSGTCTVQDLIDGNITGLVLTRE